MFDVFLPFVIAVATVVPAVVLATYLKYGKGLATRLIAQSLFINVLVAGGQLWVGLNDGAAGT